MKMRTRRRKHPRRTLTLTRIITSVFRKHAAAVRANVIANNALLSRLKGSS